MRAHGIGDETIHMDDDDSVSDWEDNKNDEHSPSGSSRRMYALRANPTRLKACRICQNCGKEFLSWKSFLEHGKCGSEDAESLLSSHDSDDEDMPAAQRGCGWSKRKRSVRVDVDNVNATCPSNEEQDLANCLVMLSNARVDPSSAEPEESCTSGNRDDETRKPPNCMASLTYQQPINPTHMDKAKGVAIARGLFECKACKKVFNSHQALGGHRASHKKVKGCFAARLDQVDDYIPEDDGLTQDESFFHKLASNNQLQYDHGSGYAHPTNSKRKSKVHECSICHRVFSSGQALGGHKRCHWITSNSPDTASLAKLQQFHDHLEQLQQSQPPNTKFHSSDPLNLKLDLNIPVPQTGFELSPQMYLQTWLGTDAKERDQVHNQHVIHIDKEHSTSKNVYTDNINDTNNVDDEGDSKVKLAKLNKLKDMTLIGEGSSSSWLQVGIGPTSTDHHRHTSSSK